MIEPVDRAVLQIRQRIVARGARELVLGDGSLLLPGIHVIGGVRRGTAIDPVTTLHGLSAVAPGRETRTVDDLALHMETVDEERVPVVPQVLENRARVLSDQ